MQEPVAEAKTLTDKTDIDVSILIPTLIGRESSLTYIKDEIERQFKELQNKQAEANEKIIAFEILVDSDNREVTTGFKRNRLIRNSVGRHIAFIDDDDAVHPDYVQTYKDFFMSDAFDVAQLTGAYYNNGKFIKPVYYSKTFEWRNYRKCFLRSTQHLTPMKRSLALCVPYENISWKEDKHFSDAFAKYIRGKPIKEFAISKSKLLYHYLDQCKDRRQSLRPEFIDGYFKLV